MTDTTLDMLELARFSVLPGAARLIRAFAAIPPGPLRESVITHAEVIASTYLGAPAEQQMPDPLLTAARATRPRPAAAIADPSRKPKTVEEEIVKLRMEGLNSKEIAQATAAVRQLVDATLKAARKAGVKFAAIAADHATGKQFVTRMEDLNPAGRSNMEKAAARIGFSLEAWMQGRATLVEMRLALKPIEDIAQATGVPKEVLWRWIYNARAAGIELATDVGYDDAIVEPVAPPRPEVIPAPGQPVFTPLKDTQPGVLKTLTETATARGLTVQAYFDLRESVILHRWAGKGTNEIHHLVGQDLHFIRNAIANAKEKGVKFPPVTSPWKPRQHPVKPEAQRLGTGSPWKAPQIRAAE